jgi:hypothetical protein
LGLTETYIAVRLANIGYGKTQFEFPQDAETVAYLADGRVLPTPVVSNEFELYPGERFDLLIKSHVPIDSFVKVSYFDIRNENFLGQNLVPLKIGANAIHMDNLGFNVWPNPFKDHFSIESLSEDPISYSILTIDGRVLHKATLIPGVNTIQTSFSSGIYGLKIGNSGRILTIVKQ